MRLAMVVQRYGLEISGGAELHARLIAEMLAPRHEVTVLTTCALDYVTWRNELPAGVDIVNGIPVLRFPVRRPRDPEKFGRLQQRVFHRQHDERDALAWMNEQGPNTPRMARWIAANREHYDAFICFSYRYWTTYRAMQECGGRGVLVPTAEPDPAVELPLFGPMFRGARAIMYNSHEERRMILQHAGNHDVPGVVVGVGIVEPPPVDPAGFRARYGLHDPFLLYVGRIDANKGCDQMFDYYLAAHRRLTASGIRPPRLVLAGAAVMEVPEHADIVRLGRVSDQDKYDALAAATGLLMPSFYESLSMVLLEAWSLARPVVVNAHCAVLQGQCRRADGGLWYHDLGEFTECLRLLASDEALGRVLGDNGSRYYRSHYAWPVIEEKYETMLRRVVSEAA